MNTTDGEKVVAFAHRFCRVTRGRTAGSLIRLHTWQRDLICDLLDSQARRAYVQMPRKNGKTLLAAVLALYGLMADGEAGAEVYSIASDREQARLVFGEAKRMAELDPTLRAVLTVTRNEIVHPKSGSKYRVLSSDAYRQEGLNASLVLADELHAHPDDTLWNTLALSTATRDHPLVLGVTTPGVRFDRSGNDTLAFRMYEYGKRCQTGEIVDSGFLFRAWEPPDAECDHLDPAVWRISNPGLTGCTDRDTGAWLPPFMNEEDFASAAKMTAENEFRTKRIGQWVVGASAWLPSGAWDALGTEHIEDHEVGVLAFDGSWSGDSSGLVLATKDERIAVLGHWEAAPGDLQWRVPIDDVMQTIRESCKRFKVSEVAADPYRWGAQLLELADERLPIVEYPQQPSRTVPATQRLFDAVVDGRLRHDGHPALKRHFANCVTKVDRQGPRITKDPSGRLRRIDLAVCSMMGIDRAAQAPSRRPFRIY